MFFFDWGDKDAHFPDSIRRFLQKDSITWSEMESLLRAFRDTRSDMTVGALLTFLYIARRTVLDPDKAGTNLTITNIADQLNVSYPTAARHCDLLSDGVRGKLGLGWLRKEPTKDLRSKCVVLSEAGIKILIETVEALKL